MMLKYGTEIFIICEHRKTGEWGQMRNSEVNIIEKRKSTIPYFFVGNSQALKNLK